MSKKNRNKFQNQVSTPSPAAAAGNMHAGEYRIIRNDLIRVAILNLLFLAAVLALYFTNKQSGYIERIFNQLFR